MCDGIPAVTRNIELANVGLTSYEDELRRASRRLGIPWYNIAGVLSVVVVFVGGALAGGMLAAAM